MGERFLDLSNGGGFPFDPTKHSSQSVLGQLLTLEAAKLYDRTDRDQHTALLDKIAQQHVPDQADDVVMDFPQQHVPDQADDVVIDDESGSDDTDGSDDDEIIENQCEEASDSEDDREHNVDTPYWERELADLGSSNSTGVENFAAMIVHNMISVLKVPPGRLIENVVDKAPARELMSTANL